MKTLRECELCGINIQHRHKIAKYCEFCSLIIKRMQTSVSDMNRPRRQEYDNWYHKYRRKGTGNIGSHPVKKNGKIDFKREQEIIHKEKIFLFKKINIYRRLIHKDYYYSNIEERILSQYRIDYELMDCIDCCIGYICYPEMPRSSDFDEEGLVMPFCDTCGVVPNV